MPTAGQTVQAYRDLAEDYGRQGQAQMRDRFLVLAADAALAAGQQDEAERLRGRLLQHNPHHLLKPYSSFAEAMKSTDVQNYVSALRRNHPYAKAENLLEGMRQSSEPSPAAEEGRTKGHTPPRPPANLALEPGSKQDAPARREDIKVFRALDAAPAKQPSPGTSPPAARPVQPPHSAQPTPPSRPTGVPDIFPLRREPYPEDMSRAVPAEREDRDSSAGAWASTGLFLLVLVMGILLAAYTFARPFLPQGWF